MKNAQISTGVRVKKRGDQTGKICKHPNMVAKLTLPFFFFEFQNPRAVPFIRIFILHTKIGPLDHSAAICLKRTECA